jgi:hypothetical protein
LPVLILHGTADQATKPSGTQHFYALAGLQDKTLKLYDGHFHDLLLPGGRAVALASPPPFRGMPRTSFSTDAAAYRTLVAAFRCVTPEYFSIAGLRVVSEHLFSDVQARTPTGVMPVVCRNRSRARSSKALRSLCSHRRYQLPKPSR